MRYVPLGIKTGAGLYKFLNEKFAVIFHDNIRMNKSTTTKNVTNRF